MLDSSVEQAAFGSWDTNAQSHLRLGQELSTNPLLRLLALQSLRLQLRHGVTWALAGIQLGSTAQHSLHFPHSTFIRFPDEAKKELLPKHQIKRIEIQLDSIYNIFEISTNNQFNQSTKIRRASARFDGSQGQSCFIFWMDCSHQSSPG